MTIYCTEHERDQYEEKGYWRSLPDMVPSVVFKTRAYDKETEEFYWLDVSTWDVFAGERVLIFSCQALSRQPVLHTNYPTLRISL